MSFNYLFIHSFIFSFLNLRNLHVDETAKSSISLHEPLTINHNKIMSDHYQFSGSLRPMTKKEITPHSFQVLPKIPLTSINSLHILILEEIIS